MELALSSCREDRTNRIDARSKMTKVNESQNSGYCDESANANISFIRKDAVLRKRNQTEQLFCRGNKRVPRLDG